MRAFVNSFGDHDLYSLVIMIKKIQKVKIKKNIYVFYKH